MTFRKTYSRLDNNAEAQAVSSLELAVMINNLRVGRLQGLRYSLQAGPRDVIEIGTDRVVEYVPGIKRYSGTIQSLTIKYGPIISRLSSMAGGTVDAESLAATISNMPEFDIQIVDRGNPDLQSPALYAPAQDTQSLAGGGKLLMTLMGCVIETSEQGINANDALVMESIGFKFVDVVPGVKGQSNDAQFGTEFSGFPTAANNIG
jgi:hypothetical protein